MSDERPRIVIVGAGFAGLTLARALRRQPVATTLVDRNNYHLFTPLVYQVASALLDPGEVAQPVRKLVRPLRNCDFRLGEVQSIDLDERRVLTDRGKIRYDYLVVAAGSANNYFGNRSVSQVALALKELPDAMALRNQVLERFEQARWATSDEERRRLLAFVVIGGGPTGVEYAGALSELIRLVLRKDYPEFDVSVARVLLLEGGERLLAPFHPSLSAAALRSLQAKHVDVSVNALVRTVRPNEIELTDGRQLPASTVIWTAGVRGGDVGAMLGVEPDRQGRVPVRSTLQLEGRPEVLVIGDLASLDRLPMLIPVAMQEAKHAANVIGALVTGGTPEPFRYRDPGMMATIGRNSAVAQLGRVRLSGFPGWVMWLGVHLINIVTFRARLVTLLNWAYEYFFLDRPVRIMVRASSPPGEGR
jgi:NADH dehydrogenase